MGLVIPAGTQVYTSQGARYQTQDRRRALRESLLERKALDWLINAAEIQEEIVTEPLSVPAGR